jgi:spore maturation protein CgeB
MRIIYFTHSLLSCWNHGNAHFQRGILRALIARGHQAVAWEPAQSWSRENLMAEAGTPGDVPGLVSHIYAGEADIEAALEGADLVIVHEWNDPALVARIGRARLQGRFTLLFHDTHHRAVSDPEAIRRFDLSSYDGVLAFGQTLARVYEDRGWRGRVFVWHEAADTTVFRPPALEGERRGAVWIGNWGDGEREAELESFLLAPAARAEIELDIHGVRYPDAALAMLRRYGARYHGWLPNAAVPASFARNCFTVHVPRRFYTQTLPGIPTIRVFEALACGIPLISAPWEDCEGLFRPGLDFLVAHDGDEMEKHMRSVLHDGALARALAASGLERVLGRHSCDARAEELIAIVAGITGAAVAA